MQGEFGGLGFNMPGHMWEDEGWGYAVFPDRESLTSRFEDHYRTILDAVESGLSAAVYTQTTDIETENNGLLTYDREVTKIEANAIALANAGWRHRTRGLRRQRAPIQRTEKQPALVRPISVTATFKHRVGIPANDIEVRGRFRKNGLRNPQQTEQN